MVENFQERPQNPSEQIALEFVNSLQTIKDLVSDGLQSGGNRVAQLRSVANDVKTTIDATSTTDAYKHHLKEKLKYAITSRLLRVSGIDFFLNECGIDIKQKQYGILDPQTVKNAEKRAFKLNYHSKYVVPEMARQHEQKMEQWRKDFQNRYGEEPITKN